MLFSIPKLELHAMAVPNASKNRKRYDIERNKATSSKYGTKAKSSPVTPCIMPPVKKHVFNPIFEAYFPNTGENINSERFAIPNTNPYSDGLAPLLSASDG